MPGHLTYLAGEMGHPYGRIEVDTHFNGCVSGSVSSPRRFEWNILVCQKKLVMKLGLLPIELW